MKIWKETAANNEEEKTMAVSEGKKNATIFDNDDDNNKNIKNNKGNLEPYRYGGGSSDGVTSAAGGDDNNNRKSSIAEVHRTPILELRHITKEYNSGRGKMLSILKDVNIVINKAEFISIVGPSGSGKSTLLKIAMGLETPSSGTILFKGESIAGRVNPSMAMVFQSFGLFPWLTVLENVEFGLESLHISKETRRQKSLDIIQEVGLDGFEDAYPRELSGGMKQRVGIARALVTDPEILLMDEPFSALDPLTAEALREEVIKVWSNKFTTPEVVIMVTHNIEEAVYLSDRVLVMSHRPGTILHELQINVPRPREKRDKQLYDYVDKITTLIT